MENNQITIAHRIFRNVYRNFNGTLQDFIYCLQEIIHKIKNNNGAQNPHRL